MDTRGLVDFEQHLDCTGKDVAELLLCAFRKKGTRMDAEDNPLDVEERFYRASRLLADGVIHAATEELLWLWDHMAAIAPATRDVRRSFLALSLRQLAEKSPVARARLARTRDLAAEERVSEGGELNVEAVRDWSILNFVVNEEAKTAEWLAGLPPSAVAHLQAQSELDRTLVRCNGRWSDVFWRGQGLAARSGM